MPEADPRAHARHAQDMALLVAAAREVGEIALRYAAKGAQSWEKPDGQGPVTEADLAVDAALHAALGAARPDYGWLSEERPDDPVRLAHERVFIIDPIDGTRAFMKGDQAWAHSLAVAEGGRVTAAVVFLPAMDKLYAAARGQGATLNGAPIRATTTSSLTSGDHGGKVAGCSCSEAKLCVSTYSYLSLKAIGLPYGKQNRPPDGVRAAS